MPSEKKYLDESGLAHYDDTVSDRINALVTGVSGVKGDAETDYRTGNVNITPANIGAAAASHTHNYAGSSTAGGAADSAKKLDGFASQSGSQDWGNQTGTFVFGMDDSTGGSLAFRRDNPSGGQLSMILDGTVYVDEGRYQVLHTNNYGSYCLPLSGGSLSGNLLINAVSGSWQEGVRINRAPSGWCGVIVGGANGSVSGAQDFLWWVGSGPPDTYGRKLYVTHNGSVSETYFYADSASSATSLKIGGKLNFRAVIYDNGAQNGTVYMTDYAYNYNHMRIYYIENNWYRHSVDVTGPNGATVLLPCPMPINNEQCTLKLKQVYISGSTISVSNSASGSIYSGYNSTRSGSANEVYIIRVEAWNE